MNVLFLYTNLGVSCGHNYTFVWATNGSVYSWGSGHYGVLGHGSEDDVLVPTKVEHLLARAVVSVGAGHDHCGIVTHDGLLFMAGECGLFLGGEESIILIVNSIWC